MSLKLTNTLSRKKEEFRPICAGEVKMYACGVTVYDECHLGHAMQAILYDVFSRYLRYLGYKVTYVRNFTDVDDKIIERASRLGVGPIELSTKMIDSSHRDLDALRVARADHEPRVSEFIPQIISFIEVLIQKGFAYTTAQGDVYFRVRRHIDYGRLSNQKIEELQNGVRVELEDGKENPLDFALWKSGEVSGASWPSPFGLGRPGWHIECSAMASTLLGSHFDIHGGGRDLVFPHHENEIAQSECHSGGPFVNYFVHNGLLTVNQQKMSKSLGNVISIQDALKRYGYELIRYAIYQFHYTSNIDFSDSGFRTGMQKLYYYYKTVSRIQQLPESTASEICLPQLEADFQEAMNDDFNLPRAMVVLNSAFQKMNEILEDKKSNPLQKSSLLKPLFQRIRHLMQILELLQREPEEFFQEVHARYFELSRQSCEELQEDLFRRRKYRETKQFALSDEIRDLWDARGIRLLDTKETTIWELNETGLLKLIQGG